MKSLQCMFAISLMLFISQAKSDEIDVKLIERSNLADEDIFQVGSWEGVQVSYHEDSIYMFWSIEEASIFPNGYHAFDYMMYGAGFGSTVKINKHFRAFGQVGLYKIVNSWGGRKRKPSEALEYYLNRKWYGLSEFYRGDGGTEWYSFDEYEVKNSNAITGTVGIEMLFDLADKWNLGASISYRLLKINEKISGYRNEWSERGPGHYWTTSQRRNYSSINLGFNLRYIF